MTSAPLLFVAKICWILFIHIGQIMLSLKIIKISKSERHKKKFKKKIVDRVEVPNVNPNLNKSFIKQDFLFKWNIWFQIVYKDNTVNKCQKGCKIYHTVTYIKGIGPDLDTFIAQTDRLSEPQIHLHEYHLLTYKVVRNQFPTPILQSVVIMQMFMTCGDVITRTNRGKECTVITEILCACIEL